MSRLAAHNLAEQGPESALAPGISVVVPVYNSAGSLPELVARLEPVLRGATSSYELVLVDDGSRDASWQTICELTAQHAWIVGLRLMRNYGQHNALLCGMRRARYDAIITIDDDLQNPPEEIPKLLRKLDEGYDVVYGAPEHKQHGLFRGIASNITRLALQSAMGAESARNVSSFRALRTELRAAFDDYRAPYVSVDVLLSWATSRFTAIFVRHERRTIGTSGYTFGKLIAHGLNMMTGFSTRPLQIASLIGFGFTFFGVAVLAYVVGRYLIQGGSVPGFAFLASTIAIFSGVQLFVLGIIGEYLARIHVRTIERPTYVVRSQSSDRAPSAQFGSDRPNG